VVEQKDETLHGYHLLNARGTISLNYKLSYSVTLFYFKFRIAMLEHLDLDITSMVLIDDCTKNNHVVVKSKRRQSFDFTIMPHWYLNRDSSTDRNMRCSGITRGRIEMTIFCGKQIVASCTHGRTH